MKSLETKQTLYSRYLKRTIDFTLALIALLVLSPLLIIVAILIKIGSRGPILFTQERPGKNKDNFKVYKFRTMVQGAVKEQKVGIEVIGSDPRITSIGKFLRRFKIDELAQLINILKGDMAIVGPRPTLPEYIEQYEDWELRRFDVRPGLTGPAQVNGNIYLGWQEKSAYDVKYVENISFIKDIKIIFKTVAIVLVGEEKFIKRTELETEKENLNI